MCQLVRWTREQGYISDMICKCKLSKEHIWFNSATIEMASLIVTLVSIYAYKLHKKLGRQIVPSSSMKLQKQNVSNLTVSESTDSRRSSNANESEPRPEEGWWEIVCSVSLSDIRTWDYQRGAWVSIRGNAPVSDIQSRSEGDACVGRYRPSALYWPAATGTLSMSMHPRRSFSSAPLLLTCCWCTST